MEDYKTTEYKKKPFEPQSNPPHHAPKIAKIQEGTKETQETKGSQDAQGNGGTDEGG